MGLDRTGTFKCKLLEHGIDGKKKKGTDVELPWFNIRVLLTEFYDPTEGEWFDYTKDEDDEPRNAEITAFLCLYGAIKKKGGEIGPTLSMDQVKKVFNWDGRSLVQLANGKYDELEFQVRIKDNDYAEATYPYQVSWIDVFDAEPGAQLRKLDAADLKSLDKQFAAMGAKTATAKPVATAAKAPAKTHPTPYTGDAQSDTPAEKQRKMAAKSAKNKAAAKMATAKAEAKVLLAGAAVEPQTGGPPPKPESEDAVVPPAKPEKTECTMQEAWEAVVELRDPTINDKVIGKVWHDAIAEVAGPDVEGENITPEQWCQIKKITLDSVAKL